MAYSSTTVFPPLRICPAIVFNIGLFSTKSTSFDFCFTIAAAYVYLMVQWWLRVTTAKHI